MPPRLQHFGGAPNNLASQYQNYPTHTQAHSAGLPPPSLGSNTGFMNANSMNNPFALNGNALSLSGGFGNTGLGMPGGTGLASQAAQMSFAGASLQQGHNMMGEPAARAARDKGRIREVWKSNLHEEMGLLRQLVDKYQYIAMDTEFPGVVARPMGSFNGKSDYHYQCLRCNVDLLKIIQLGITLFDDEGDLPSQASPEAVLDMARGQGQMSQLPSTWQFNFKFSLKEDMYSEGSIDALRQAGVEFQNLDREGIDPFEFGALLISSGLVCDEEVRWISFHGGYDFGYLTKLLLRLPLPNDEYEFVKFMKKFFPSVYDIKYLMKYACRLHNMGQPLTPSDAGSIEILQKFDQKSSLENLAEILKVKRQGAAHQAGSDSLLTGKAFFKMRERIFNGEIHDEHVGKVWGLGWPESGPPHSNSTSQHYQHQQENATPNQNGYTNGTPSTPNTGNAGLVHTPLHNNGGGAIGPMTPGGGGGVFGSFQFGRQ